MLGELSQRQNTQKPPLQWYYPIAKTDGTGLYVPAFTFIQSSTTLTTYLQSVVGGIDRLLAFSWYVPNDITITDAAIIINAAVATSTLRCGIYHDIPGLAFPGKLLQEFGVNSASATIDCSQAAGVYAYGLITPFRVRKGYYWMTFMSHVAAAKLSGGFNTSQIVGSPTQMDKAFYPNLYYADQTANQPFPAMWPNQTGPVRGVTCIPCPQVYLKIM